MSEWQPISTAPKDGTEVLAFWSNSCSMGIVLHETRPNRQGRHWCDEEGYVSDPTHWMPLPDPPPG